MMLLASKLWSHIVGSEAALDGFSPRYFINSIATLFSIVDPPAAPMANGGLPPTTPFVGEAGESGTTIAGDILSTGRLPGPIEFGQPGRASNKSIPCPKPIP